MNPRICRCCGERIHVEGNLLSRNPNVCASCSSMADGMEDANVPDDTGSTQNQRAVAGFTEATTSGEAGGQDLESLTHLLSNKE
jgi:hypothetical protein